MDENNTNQEFHPDTEENKYNQQQQQQQQHQQLQPQTQYTQYNQNTHYQQNDNRQQLQNDIPFLKSLKNWSTFQAILEIISGAFMCLGIITAIIGVPKIIAGVKLLNAGDNLRDAMVGSDERKVTDSLYNMGSYFKLNGISNIISIAFSVLAIVFWIILIVFFIKNISQLTPWNYDFKYDYNY
ncbi:MAG: DUF5362 domain-containing protein [Eubacteriales bacterium]|nr:DUF5362 domain-containing protein [Eubacteriales bacterium]